MSPRFHVYFSGIAECSRCWASRQREDGHSDGHSDRCSHGAIVKAIRREFEVQWQPMPRGPRVRRRVFVFAFFLALITYLDRVCISAAAPFIMDDLHLSVLQMSAVFSAFTLAYSLFEIPSGWLGDVAGPRRVLTRIVLWWSAFTMLTSAARGFQSLVAIRFLFGAGEAGAFPNIARSFSKWFPIRERGRANGVMFLGSRVRSEEH